MNQSNSPTQITNKHGQTVKIGDVLFMQCPRSSKWPQAFPESSWLFIVKSLNHKSLQGPTINWKRKGGNTWVSREYDELISSESIINKEKYGLRHATEEETAYFFKRKPEYKKWLDELKKDV